jgi:hypothetical protein
MERNSSCCKQTLGTLGVRSGAYSPAHELDLTSSLLAIWALVYCRGWSCDDERLSKYTRMCVGYYQ